MPHVPRTGTRQRKGFGAVLGGTGGSSANVNEPLRPLKSSYGQGSMFSENAQDASLQQALKDRARASELRVIRRIFTNFDADGSGSIDVGELRAVMEAMGHSLTDTQLEELVQQVDANESGDIDFDEFVQLINIWKEANQFKLFETSSSSLTEQRIAKAKKVNLYLPDQKRIVAWHCVVLAFIVYTFFVTGYLIALSAAGGRGEFSTAREALLGFDIAASVVFAVDVFVTFFTAVRVSLNGPQRMEVIDDPKEVAKRYVGSPWFWVDVVAIPPALRFLPKDYIWLAAFFIVLKALKIPKLFQRSGKQKMTPAYVYLHFYLVPAMRVLCYFVFGVHFLAVVWTLVFAATTDQDADASAAAAAAVTSAPVATVLNSSAAAAAVTSGNATAAPETGTSGSGGAERVKQFQLEVSYVNSLYFVLYTLTTAGYGDVLIDGSDLRLILAIPLCVGGTLLTGLVVGSVVSILSKTDIDRERENKLRETLAVCQHFSVPKGVVDEVLNFQNHILADSLSEAYSDLVMGLPADMKLNINLFTRVDLISQMPYFQQAHQGARVAIAALLTTAVVRPQEVICAAGEQGDCMYFIGYGFVDVVKKSGTLLAVLKRGDFFGEAALLQANQTRNATCVAVTYCDLFVLDRPNFEKVLRQFPRFKMAIVATSRERAAQQQLQQLRTPPSAPSAPPGEAAAGASTETAPTLKHGFSFLHERMEAQDRIDQQIAEAHRECDDTVRQCLSMVNSMEAMLSELNRQRSSGTRSNPTDSATGGFVITTSNPLETA